MNKESTQETTKGTVKIIYVLYLVGVVFWLTGIIGVVMAYVNRGDAPDWLKTHYQFQIRTFWIGALYMLIGAILTIFVIGYILIILWMVWLIIRCIKGIKYLDKEEAYPSPTKWLI